MERSPSFYQKWPQLQINESLWFGFPREGKDTHKTPGGTHYELKPGQQRPVKTLREQESPLPHLSASRSLLRGGAPWQRQPLSDIEICGCFPFRKPRRRTAHIRKTETGKGPICSKDSLFYHRVTWEPVHRAGAVLQQRNPVIKKKIKEGGGGERE